MISVVSIDLAPLQQKINMNIIKMYVKSKIFEDNEDTKMLEFNQYQKSDEVPFIIYADLQCSV